MTRPDKFLVAMTGFALYLGMVGYFKKKNRFFFFFFVIWLQILILDTCGEKNKMACGFAPIGTLSCF